MISRKQPLMSRFIIFSVSLFLIIIAGGTSAFVFSMREIIKENKSIELPQLLEIERIKLEAYVNEGISVALKLTSSPIITEFFAKPESSELEYLARREMDSIRKTFSDSSFFWVSDINKRYYFNGEYEYTVDISDPDNAWYTRVLNQPEKYTLDINYNPGLDKIMMWIDAVIVHEGKPVGIAGTGTNVSDFLDTIYKGQNGRTMLYFFDADGIIRADKNIENVNNKANINDELKNTETDILSAALNLSEGETAVISTPLGMTAVSAVPLLGWYSVAISPSDIRDYNTAMTALFLVVVVIMFLIFVIFNVFVYYFLKSLKKAMISLETAKNEAIEANRSKSNFLAVISHEIRTPLNAIIGLTQIQLQNQTLPTESVITFERINSSGNSLLGIINDILDMSKVETGNLEIFPAEYDMPSLINDSVQLNAVRIGTKPIEFLLDIDRNLPSKLIGDELRLRQILNNLLSNAIKYTEAGTVSLSVYHKIERGTVILRFRVEDTGQGMTEEDLKQLFTAFSRFNSEANRTTEGTGLGLNITKRLVELMGGTIEVESEYGKGSVFTVTVKQQTPEGGYRPIGVDIAERMKSFKYVNTGRSEQLNIYREPMPYGKILIVDDVETNLYVAKGLLLPYRLQIDTAVSGFEAIEKIDNGNLYDIIFMDHMMPKKDGVETTKDLRGLGYKGIIVALTANALAGNDEFFKNNGFDGFVPKPIDIRHLNTVLNKYIRDKHPKEAEKARAEAEANNANAAAISEVSEAVPNQFKSNPKFMKIFSRDLKKAVTVIREAINEENNEKISTAVHGMKSALANMGEPEMSEKALELETAIKTNDAEKFRAGIDEFIESLEALIEKLNTN